MDRLLFLSRVLAACILAVGGPALPAAPPSPITEFDIPTASSAPRFIVLGSDGNLWFTEDQGNQIGKITPAGMVTEYRVPTRDSRPDNIILGPDGNVWFTEGQSNKIGRITPAGVIDEYPIGPSRYPANLISGPDGNLWFTTNFASSIQRLTPAGIVSEYPLSVPPVHVVIGGDNNIWFTQWTQGVPAKVGKITVGGVVTEYSLPAGNTYPGPMVLGPDGHLWFGYGADKIASITANGIVTQYPLPTADAWVSHMVAGPDGNLWFTESKGKIGRLTPTGAVTEYITPSKSTAPFISSPSAIMVGPDGNLWYADLSCVANCTVPRKIGRITVDGSITEYVIPTANANVLNIVVGADGNLWFAESAGKIGRLEVALTMSTPTPQAILCTGDCSGDGFVTIDELLKGVNIALGISAVAECPSFDSTNDGEVTVDELLRAVSNALQGCQHELPSPTATATPTAQPTTGIPVATRTPTQQPTPSSDASEFVPMSVGRAWTVHSTMRTTVGGDVYENTGDTTSTVTDISNGVITVHYVGESRSYNGTTSSTRGTETLIAYAGSFGGTQMRSETTSQTGLIVTTTQFDPPLVSIPSNTVIGYTETISSGVTTVTQLPNGSEQYSTSTISSTLTVIGYEDVTVPAGTFRQALKIRDDAAPPAGSTAPVPLVFRWYARGVGFIKSTAEISFSAPGYQSETVTTTVLTSYHVP